MAERRYTEEEVAEIFRAAADTQVTRRNVDASAGMTLAELQDIGREAGLDPDAVAHAARMRDQPAVVKSSRFLGLKIGVGKTVQLARPMTDMEWDRLVVLLRETFEATGQVTGHGSLREWRNGNLRVALEPTATGQQLRMKTVKGNVRPRIVLGIVIAAIGIIRGVADGLGNGDTLATV